MCFIFAAQFTALNAKVIKKITIKGNDRISNESILLFSGFKINETITNDKLDEILKNLYDTNFFQNISVNVENDLLIINVLESPIIDVIEFEGIKSKTIKQALNDTIKLKSRSSYDNFLISEDRRLIKEFLKNMGYYFSEVETAVQELDNNLVKITHKINLGKKAKIKKISFIGNKIYKQSKLKNIIVSEEYKFWKFISGKKFLNEQTINLSKFLLLKSLGIFKVKSLK